VNGQDTVNGFTDEQMKNAGVGQVVTEADCDGTDDDDDDDDDDDLTLASCQPTVANCVYDLCIHNQTLLWKALPKPSNTSQVCFHH